MRNFNQKWQYLLLLWLSLSFSSSAIEVNDFFFTHLSHGDGLCSQRIYSISQTSDGAIWWAAKNCVERYNGVSVKCYKIDTQDSHSYYAGRYLGIYSSTDDRLFAYDNKGRVFEYDSDYDSFEPVTDIRPTLNSDIILNDLYITRGQMWFATSEGIYFMEQGTGNLLCLHRCRSVNRILEVNSRLFFCTSEGLMECRESDTGSFVFKTLLPHNVSSGYFDEKNSRLWIGCFNDGVKVLTLATNGKVIDVVGVDYHETPVRHPVRSIYPYNDEVMLVGVDGMGVLKSNRKPSHSGNHFLDVLFDANSGENGVLHGNGIYSMLCDKWGNIIVGSYSGGIDIAHPADMISMSFTHQHNNDQSILNNHVNAVIQLPDGTLAMGTDNGVSFYNINKRTWTHSLKGSVVIDLTVLSSGKLLAATYGEGVFEIYPDFQSRPVYNTSNGMLKDNHAYCVFEDKDGGLWIGCLDGDMTYINGDTVEYYSINNVKDIIQLPDGDIAVGTVTGILLIDGKSKKISGIDFFSASTRDVNVYICDMLYRNDGTLWIGTDGGGIYIYEMSNGNCRQMTITEGLPSNTVSSLCEDSFGRVLVSTDYGLAYVDEDAPQKAVSVNYGYEVSREYVGCSVAVLNDKQILYGTTTGALIINPENLKDLDYAANLNILNVYLNHGNGQNTELRQMLEKGKVSLRYSERTFDVNFEAINLRNQNDIVYQYKIEGDEWSVPSPIQYIGFTNMEPGTHVLSIRCLSDSCGKVLDVKKLEISIGRPWWSSGWMWCIYIILLMLTFYAFWYFYQLQTQYMRIAVNNPNLAYAVLPGKRIIENIRARNEKAVVDGDGKDFVEKVTSLVIGHISESNFNIDQLCREMAMSRTVFYLKLKAYTGKSPQDFIKVLRLERAAALLRSGKSVSEVADLVGFDNSKYFSTVFKKYFGISPSKYK